MHDIDWKTVEQTLPPGLLIRGSESLKDCIQSVIRSRIGKEGLLLRYGVEWASPYVDATIVQFFDDPREWNFEPFDLEYSFDKGKTWLTFDQAMALP
jgi:hypothetical protein